MTATEFLDRLDKSGGPDSCWPFRGARTRGNYANVWFSGRYWRGNRLALFLAAGRIVHQALHTCDNPPCCNHRHLYDGTPKRNHDDAKDRGRVRTGVSKGSANGNSKLSEADVRAIRASGETGAVLAERYKITKSNVSHIRRRFTWKDVS